MTRHLIICAGGPNPKLCSVRIIEQQEVGPRTIHFNGRVNYGVAIVGIMEEWDTYKIVYTRAARDKFLLKKLDPSLLT